VAEEKKKKVDYKQAWGEARELVWEYRYRLALGFVLMLFNRLVGMVLPASSKYLIDEVIMKHRSDLIFPIAIVGGAATIAQAITSFALSQVLGVAAQGAITTMRMKVMEQVLRLPIGYFDSMKTGKLISRVMNDAEGVRNLVGTGLIQLLGGIVTAALSLTVLLYLNWRLTLVTILVLAVFGGLMALAFTKLRPLFRERGEIYSELTGRLAETVGGIRTVKAYTAEKREELVFTRGAHKLLRNVTKSMTAVSATMASTTVIAGIIGVLMIFIGGRSVLNGEMTLGELFMYVFFTGLVAMPLIEIANIGTQITEAFAGLDRIREIKQLVTEVEGDEDRNSIAEVRGDVKFDGVWFEYTEGVPVLKNINFHAPAGTTTALVGSSGSGKSTMIGLVMNFAKPQQGRVLIDDRELSSLKLRDYRSHLGIVMQDNFLFDGTIAENISFSNPNASMEQILAVSKVAHCAEFIDGFEKKYDTIIGERGIKLSGGQRQRLSIARAILANPRILILDEATSSLDSESEAMIQDGLQTLRQGRTTFVIAHRLSTIRSANQILVLENGEIVEQGSHQELIALDGRYKQLYDKQYKFETDRFINPGEDFTPEPEKVEMPKTAQNRS
jgi:ABC-type multidrug transport system fused ATPase/permease subunit